MEKRNDHNSAGPKPVNATTEFIDDTDFVSDIPTDGPATVEMVNATKDNFDVDDLVKFQELLLDAEKPLYEGCPDFTKLSAIVKLLNLKGKYGASDKFFTELLGLIKKMLPAGILADGVDVTGKRRGFTVYGYFLTSNITFAPCWCMKRKFINLSVLISGYPGNDIDVFLEPLVDDLHTLFETGVDTYDASIKDNFNLRAVVLWTINDYPALGTLCGTVTVVFKRRYLPYNHPFRKQKKAFNGQQEFLQAPIPMTGEQIYNEVKHIENKWGKGKRTNNNASENQEDTRGRGGKIQKQKRNTTEEEGSSSQVNRQNGVYWKKFNIWNVAVEDSRTLLHVLGKTKDDECSMDLLSWG
ncbi:RNA-directed DNA polymerase, eukaryota [Tanacetum coccineum]